MSARKQTMQNAQATAIADLEKGLRCDSSRHGARPGSAWDEWYTQQYQASEGERKRLSELAMTTLSDLAQTWVDLENHLYYGDYSYYERDCKWLLEQRPTDLNAEPDFEDIPAQAILYAEDEMDSAYFRDWVQQWPDADLYAAAKLKWERDTQVIAKEAGQRFLERLPGLLGDAQFSDAGNIEVWDYVGSVFGLYPSGKYYMPFACSNVISWEAIQDEVWRETVDRILEDDFDPEHVGISLAHGEGDPCDLFLVAFFPTARDFIDFWKKEEKDGRPLPIPDGSYGDEKAFKEEVFEYQEENGLDVGEDRWPLGGC